MCGENLHWEDDEESLDEEDQELLEEFAFLFNKSGEQVQIGAPVVFVTMDTFKDIETSEQAREWINAHFSGEDEGHDIAQLVKTGFSLGIVLSGDVQKSLYIAVNGWIEVMDGKGLKLD